MKFVKENLVFWSKGTSLYKNGLCIIYNLGEIVFHIYCDIYIRLFAIASKLSAGKNWSNDRCILRIFEVE
jgi:hypothetical protein